MSRQDVTAIQTKLETEIFPKLAAYINATINATAAQQGSNSRCVYEVNGRLMSAFFKISDASETLLNQVRSILKQAGMAIDNRVVGEEYKGDEFTLSFNLSLLSIEKLQTLETWLNNNMPQASASPVADFVKAMRGKSDKAILEMFDAAAETAPWQGRAGDELARRIKAMLAEQKSHLG